LYAIGETASTGLHGANRLASNSLLECVVSAYELADYLSFVNLEPPQIIDSTILAKIEKYSEPISDIDYDIETLKADLKEIMWKNVGIIRAEQQLKYAINSIDKMTDEFRKGRCISIPEYEYKNMLIVSKIIAESALNRKESRGAHSRSDYPQTEQYAEHSYISYKNKMEILEYA
jgi:L-aspartate oxidase